MENIVYIFGAGFSAPLGLPVMSNFISKAKNLYDANNVRYSHFLPIIKETEDTLQLNYRSDPSHIEEALSTLEMKRLVEGKSGISPYKTFVKEVIEATTPPPQDMLALTNQFPLGYFLFGDKDSEWSRFGPFVASLFSLTAEVIKAPEPHFDKPITRTHGKISEDCKARYSIITLNYDSVLDDILKYIRLNLARGINLQFVADEVGREPPGMRMVSLLKLHGSVSDPNSIDLPTWNKNMYTEEKSRLLRVAYNLLSHATQLRIIGYSLPPGDSHVRYLLKVAGKSVFNLKVIDILCLEQGVNIAEKEYRDFIRSGKGRFINADVRTYLDQIRNYSAKPDGLMSPDVEDAHNNFFDGAVRI